VRRKRSIGRTKGRGLKRLLKDRQGEKGGARPGNDKKSDGDHKKRKMPAQITRRKEMGEEGGVHRALDGSKGKRGARTIFRREKVGNRQKRFEARRGKRRIAKSKCVNGTLV